MHSQLSQDVRRRILKKAVQSRVVEEALLALFSEGSLHGTVHTCIGQEFSGAVVTEFLRSGDTIFSNHRCHGHFLSRHGDVEGLIAEVMGRATGVSGGLGGSQHLYKDGFYSNGIQGGTVPVSAGLALGHKIRGEGTISVVFIGDGTLGEGVLYETLNLVSKWALPLLIVLEDNKIAQSTAQAETLAGDVRSRFEAFGIETASADTWNWEDLYDVADGLVSRMRTDGRPKLLHIATCRLRAHSKGDDTRPRDEVAPFEKIDPLNVFLASATTADAVWIREIQQRVADAIALARAAPHAKLPTIADDTRPASWNAAHLPAQARLVTALNETLLRHIAQDPATHLIGEDVQAPYGGAFKVSKGLSDAFPERVRNTPISEAAIVGLGIGMSMAGLRPVVEIMFGDFVGLAFDQLVNHAAKFHEMYNGQVGVPVIVRTPMGGGRGYGPTHSQTLDRHFLGVPGLRVLAVNHLTNPAQLYDPLFGEKDSPTLVIENKLLYSEFLLNKPPEGFRLLHGSGRFPAAWLEPETEQVDITLLGYGGTSPMLVEVAETLFDEHDLVAQVICVMELYPFRIDSILEPLQRAPQLLIVEEGQGFAGFSAELIAQLYESHRKAAPIVARHGPAAHCIPSAGPLEREFLPSVESVVSRVLQMKNR